MEINAPITADEFRLLNGCLDNATASAVTQFGRERNQSTIDGGVLRENERLGFFAHELRNFVHTALIAYEVVKSGNVGVDGSTGIVLHRSLVGARDLIARSLAEVRLTQGVQHRVPFLVSGLIEEVALGARLASEARGVRFTVTPVGDDVAVEADRQTLAGAVANLLQNAFNGCVFTIDLPRFPMPALP